MLLTDIRIPLYQKWLYKAFRDIERSFYTQIDDLIQKLADLERNDVKVPDIVLTKYSFVADWENGALSTDEVLNVFEYMNIENAAKAKITKPLYNYMLNNDVVADHVKPVIAELEKTCVPEMIKYLELMRRVFNKMGEVDKKQIPISWVQQEISSTDMTVKTEEMTLNQCIKCIQTFVNEGNVQKFFMKDSIIILDEDIGEDERLVHWLFAPRGYTELMKGLFGIKEEMKDDNDVVYLKKIIEVYSK